MGEEDFNKLKTWKNELGRARHGKLNGSRWRDVGVVHKVLGLSSVPSGAEIDEPLWTTKKKTRKSTGKCGK